MQAVLDEYGNKLDEFDDFLERLYRKAEEKPTEPQPEYSEKEKQEQDKRDKDYENAVSNLELLKYIITNRGRNKATLKSFSSQLNAQRKACARRMILL